MQSGFSNPSAPAPIPPFPPHAPHFGFRVGDVGTHTSRTMMLEDLTAILSQVGATEMRVGYSAAIVGQNALGKRTESTRRLADQRLSELYALDPSVTLFRVLRELWSLDTQAQPEIAILCAIARDPLLRATAGPILAMRPGEELSRQSMTDAIRASVGNRLSASTVDKVVRNTSSSWAQSGHVEGRTRKIRRLVVARPASTAYALALGYLVGQRGQRLFRTFWASLLDSNPEKLRALAATAKQQGLLDMKVSGDVVEIHFPQLLTASERRESSGTD